MINFAKKWWFWFVILLIVFILLAGWFYWFQLRPLKIKKNCNWVERINYTYEAIKNDNSTDTGSLIDEWKNGTFHSAPNATVSIPTSKYWGRATDSEYNMCLRLKGFK